MKDDPSVSIAVTTSKGAHLCLNPIRIGGKYMGHPTEDRDRCTADKVKERIELTKDTACLEAVQGAKVMPYD